MRLCASLFVCGFAALLPVSAQADSLVIDGQSLDGVHIREEGDEFYVRDPQTGGSYHVPKSAVEDETLAWSNEKDRARILADWFAARAKKSPVSNLFEQTPTRGEEPQGQKTLRLSGSRGKQGQPSVHLGNYLRARLRSKGLEYQVVDNMVYIAPPGRLRALSGKGLQTQSYRFNDAGAALPKVVLRNPGQANGFGASGNSSADYRGTGRGQGRYGNSSGNRNTGVGNQDGYRNGGGGNQGGFNRGGGGGRGGDVTSISNISDLFSTIDDRMVGETPAVIGAQIQYMRR